MIARATALVALVAALVVAVASASGPLEPRGRLLFVRSVPPFSLDRKRSIVELDLATGRERVVAPVPHRLYPTGWSPDFRQVALVFLPPVTESDPNEKFKCPVGSAGRAGLLNWKVKSRPDSFATGDFCGMHVLDFGGTVGAPAHVVVTVKQGTP